MLALDDRASKRRCPRSGSRRGLEPAAELDDLDSSSLASAALECSSGRSKDPDEARGVELNRRQPLPQQGVVPPHSSCSSLAEAATLDRRVSPGCTDRTYGRSWAEDDGAFGPNFRTCEKEELGVRLAVVATLE